MRFTKDLRQKIVSDFARRHNGQFNPSLFLDEVRETGETHPAYEWFEWDTEKAALSYQVEQARNFARDLRVTFKIEEIGRDKKMTVRESVMPMVISPMAGRRSGGGYIVVNADDPQHIAEHCHQAASALRSWLERYESACIHAGASVPQIEKIAKLLETVTSQIEVKAA